MAVQTGAGGYTNRRAFVYTWTGVLNGNSGNFVDITGFNQVTFHIRGTLGVGGSINIEGSSDGGTTVKVLSDTGGTALTITAIPDVRDVRQLPTLVRPNVTAGDGTTSFTVTMTARSFQN